MTTAGPKRPALTPGMGGLMKASRPKVPEPKHPGVRTLIDGGRAAITIENAACRESRSADRGDARAAAVAAGLSMSGARASTLSGGQGVASMHESLYAAAGKRLTYVVNIASRAMTKQALSTHAGHDDYHAVDDTGVFQLFAKNGQAVADLALIAHRVAELALTPGLVAQDAFLTSHRFTSVQMPEASLIAEYLGESADMVDSPTPAQRLVYGDTRRRIPEHFDLDYPALLGTVQDPDSYAQGVAAQRPFYFDHVAELTDRAMAEYADLTGRAYSRAHGYRLADAEYVLVGQGSIVPTCEALCDHLRAAERLRIGVLDLTMFRPFPADLVSRLLVGKKAVTVLERVDQPLAVDAPLLREIRATMSQAVENARAKGVEPHAGIAPCRPARVPDFFSGCVGLGSRDVQAADLIAAVDNMRAGANGRRHFYLGIDFVRPGTRFPKQQVWQEQLVDRYPRLAGLALRTGEAVDLLPPDTVSVRLHAREAAEAATLGRRLADTAVDALGLHVQAQPGSGIETTGQPATFDLALAAEPIRVGCDVKQATVALALDPHVFDYANPLDGLAAGGLLILDWSGPAEDAWARLPAAARRTIVDRQHRVAVIDVSSVAAGVALDGDTPDRHAAFIGAFLRASDLGEREGLTDETLTDRAVQRGFADVTVLDPKAHPAVEEDPGGRLPAIPAVLGDTDAHPGFAHGGRFWEQVGVLHQFGQDGLADPFAALGAVPAATSAIHDMTTVRVEVPEFVPDRCTGCSECWVQCPDTAIPGVVNTVDEVLNAALETVAAQSTCDRVRQILKPLVGETRRQLKAGPFTTFADVVSRAYDTVADKLGVDPERRRALDAEFAAVSTALAEFPLAKTEAFFDAHERTAKGTGGLLSITIDPGACKGCKICVTACPEGALRTVRQTDDVVDTLRRNWALWTHLPETNDRYLTSPGSDDAPLPSLLLKQSIYRSMIGGDDTSPGSTEKTALHLVLSAVNAYVLPRVARHVARLTELIDALDTRARTLLASDAPIESVETLTTPADTLTIPLDEAKHKQVEWIATLLRELKDLRWRYTEGPSGKGRSTCGIAGTADRSMGWGGTYPYNPYPFPWVSHLLQDAPSVAIGLFDGQMQKMARAFTWIRRAELELSDAYDADEHEPFFAGFDWRQFTDDEFALCPPLLAVGGDDALVDSGLQHLSHLLASDRPIRIVVLDTEGATERDSGATGRRNLALLAMAHRHAFVLQSSPAVPSHLLAGVLGGLDARRPAVFAVHCPHVPNAGSEANRATRAAKLALESRAFPALVYDPGAGVSLAERLNLDGNPSPDEAWPTYELTHLDADGTEQTLTLPVTIADWAATEVGFGRYLRRPTDAAEDATWMRFDEYLAASAETRADRTPFIHVLEHDRQLGRLQVSDELVALAEERLGSWHQLRQMAGIALSTAVRDRVAASLEADFDRRLQDIESRHQATVADMESRYPTLVARRLVEGLIRASGDGTETIGDLLRRAAAAPGIDPLQIPGDGNGAAGAAPTIPAMPATATAGAAPPVPAAAEAADVEEDDDESLTMDPYIQSALCTTCDECLNINKRLFAYDKKKQAFIKDVRAGTYRELVLAAEKCPVKIIHPGTPLNPDEPNLEKWVQAAAPFM